MKNSLSYQAFKNSPYQSIKHTTYFETYDQLFSKYRGKNITFVEVGIFGGGSLFMWRDYFGPEARIIGIDLNPEVSKWEKDGFEIFVGSQSDPKFWAEFKEQIGDIDIVLDDGGHCYDQQIITSESLIGNIKDGGMLVVEDTHTSYMEGFGPRSYSFIEYVKNLIDRVNLRFSKLDGSKSERRIWSIEVFESIVAFKINHKATSLLSEPVNNGGISDGAMDFTYNEASLKWFNKIAQPLMFLKNINLVKRLGKAARNQLVKYRFAAKKYFLNI